MKYDGFLVHILPTQKCNLQCKYCYTDSSPEKNFENCCDYVNKVAKLVNGLPITVIHIEGGEPLLYEEIFDLIRVLKRKDKLYLVTNGYLITEKTAMQLKESGLQNIIVSLDYANEKFDIDKKACIQSLKILNNVGFLPEISVAMTKNNIEEMESLFALSQEYSIKRIRFGEIVRVGAAIKNALIFLTAFDYQNIIPVFLKLSCEYSNLDSAISLNGNVFEECESSFKYKYETIMDKRPCNMNQTMITIDDKGDIYTCCNLVGQKRFLIGNICEEWEEIIRGEKYQKIKSSHWTRCPVGRGYHLNMMGNK